ncbi:hypothetical protein GPECTOR_5g375 [Gonium pectorale]|uniref:Patatin n=1 Tax=Gonium pectorale TaxID=33097 RepID=A0A150GX79_GONPE|nr:hypothetical protein GPECTOR_5g375 [Gonium pectorale]|eukprot:KXZ54288.1 hypothetical protein GPECTOR_5g375 [Gonium pectorale]
MASPSAPTPLAEGSGDYSTVRPSPVLSAPQPLPGLDATDSALGSPGADSGPSSRLPPADLLLEERRHSAAVASSSTAAASSGRGTTRLHHRHHPHRHPHSTPHHKHHSHHHRKHHHHYPASPLHPTLRLIADRVRSGSAPGARTDGKRLGLVVEGGGMRGCISGAMLMGLLDLGLTNAFDAVYGASAGAINATYYLAGQREGLRVYYEDLTRGTAFLDFRNLFSRSSRPVMNIDFLIDDVLNTSKPLDWDTVLASPVPLKVVASCIDSCQPVLLDNFADRAELAEALKASAAVPQFAGPPRQLRGRTLVDAAVFEPVPVPSAIRDGCDHVLVLCTRPPYTGQGPLAKKMRTTVETLAKTTVLNAPYMRQAWRTASDPAMGLPDEQLVAALRSCPHAVAANLGAYVLPLYPESTAGCHPLCLDPPTIMAACDVGRDAMLRLLGPIVAAAAAGADQADEVATMTAAAALEAGAEWAMGGEFGDAELYTPGMELRYRP